VGAGDKFIPKTVSQSASQFSIVKALSARHTKNRKNTEEKFVLRLVFCLFCFHFNVFDVGVRKREHAGERENFRK